MRRNIVVDVHQNNHPKLGGFEVTPAFVPTFAS